MYELPKPKLTRRWYPKLGRYFWMVSPKPKSHMKDREEIRKRWAYAHKLALEMNSGKTA